MNKQEPSAQPMRVLVIDDDARVQNDIVGFLQDEGYEVRAPAAAGMVLFEKAQEAARSFRPHVAIVDISLDGTRTNRGGISLLEDLKSAWCILEQAVRAGFPGQRGNGRIHKSVFKLPKRQEGLETGDEQIMIPGISVPILDPVQWLDWHMYGVSGVPYFTAVSLAREWSVPTQPPPEQGGAFAPCAYPIAEPYSHSIDRISPPPVGALTGVLREGREGAY